MKRTQFKKAVALLLLGSMMSGMAVSADAAWFGGSSKKTEEFYKSWDAQLRDFLAEKQNNKNNKPGQNKKPDKENNGNNNPGQENNTDSAGSSTVIESEMTVVEDATTVENGEMLRASTYVLNSVSGSNAELYAGGTTVKYFPVTMYDYDATTINKATHAVEYKDGLTAWNGMYFGNGQPASDAYTYITSAAAHTDLTWVQVQNENGTYYSDEACTTRVTVNSIGETGSDYVEATYVTFNDIIASDGQNVLTNYYYKKDNQYYSVYATRSSGNWYQYQFIYYPDGLDRNPTVMRNKQGYTSCYPDDPTDNFYNYYSSYRLYTKESVITGYTLTAGSETLATLDGTDTSKEIGVTLYTAGGTITTASLTYAPHNVWADKIFDADTPYSEVDFGKLGLYLSQPGAQVDDVAKLPTRAGYVYNGLVKNELDANKNIQFNVPEGGIFNSDATVKEIYTNVGLPFDYDADTLTYTFDSDEKSAKFDGTARSNTNLVEDTNGGFFPFGGYSAKEFYHGMSATINFNMTTDGKLVLADGSKDPITFAFSGDDDVWVFIDGVLVLDIGGIHDRANGYLNFSDESVTFTTSGTSGNRSVTLAANSSLVVPNSSSVGPGIINTTEGAVAYPDGITGQLFNTYDSYGNLLIEGVLGQDIQTFAAKADHELTIFYLERGADQSNCMIEFNLPVLDNVTVTKNIAGQAVVTNGNLTTEALNMSDDQLAALNNLEFTFTLYKNGEALANKTYIRMNANGQTIAIPSTDASGKFVLKNGETAKFIGEFSPTEDEYYVVEDIKNGFIYTDYKYSRIAAGSSAEENEAAGEHTYFNAPANDAHVYTDMEYEEGVLTSKVVTIKGGLESEDSLAFVANNYVNASLPTPSAVPSDDKIVIDYGLPVKITPTQNDLYIGDDYTISFPSGVGEIHEVTDGVYKAAYGTFTYDAATETITYTLNKQLSGVEVLTYYMTATAKTRSGSVPSEPVPAYIYIIPATTMYYEENFSDMVTFTNGTSKNGWQVVGSSQTDPQEPGVVGTVDDSPYGSDVAYINDSGDSNGTSMYVDTTAHTVKVTDENGNVKTKTVGAAQFSYEFTGTGTAFYARTTKNTGLMQITITNSDGEQVIYYRDTAFTWAVPMKVTAPDDAAEWLDSYIMRTSYDVVKNGTPDLPSSVQCYLIDNTPVTGTIVWGDVGTATLGTQNITGELTVTKNDGSKMKTNVTAELNVLGKDNIRLNNDIELYNIPVFDTDNIQDEEFASDSIGVMPYGTYTVTVTIARSNENLGYGSDFWLDGIRVYQPLDPDPSNLNPVAASAYATDGEANMVNATLRYKLLCDEDINNDGNWDGSNFTLFTDSNGSLETAEEYDNIGPKNEVYLYSGQSVTFTLSGFGWDANTNKVYLGMKAPAGVGNVTIGNKTMQINNTVDCYYDISGYGTISDIIIDEDTEETIKAVTFTITAGENSLISLTNVRVTGNAKFIVVNYPNVKVPGSGK